MKILRTITICCLACLSLQATAQAYKLWYDKPALVWTDALPLGNGRLGAMVYGIPATERLQLNEETIWAGQPNKNANPHAKAALPVVQNLIWQGEYRKAQDMCTEKSCRIPTLECLTNLSVMSIFRLPGWMTIPGIIAN